MKTKVKQQPAPAEQMQRIMRSFGQAVREARTERAMSMVELAPQLGLSAGNICDIENGKRNLTIPAMLGICEKLGIEARVNFKL